MEREQTIPISARIPLSLLAEVQKELKETKQNMNEFINESVKDKLYNNINLDLIEKQIELYKELINNLENKKKESVEKEKSFNEISKAEISFLLETKELLEKDPTYIQGRINLYKNKFGKHFRISINDFFKLLDKAAESE